jgi:hypothetical protein
MDYSMCNECGMLARMSDDGRLVQEHKIGCSQHDAEMCDSCCRLPVEVRRDLLAGARLEQFLDYLERNEQLEHP